jgi:hypothetical protein
MASLADLRLNPVVLNVRDGDREYIVSAERGKAGKVWLTCQCPDSTSQGWCVHRLDLLNRRFDFASDAGGQRHRAFSLVVDGTPLGEAGQDADRALSAFTMSLQALDDGRPRQIVGKNLGKFTELVSDVAVCSGELEDALAALRRLLDRD